MAHLVTDLVNLYQTYFAAPYHVSTQQAQTIEAAPFYVDPKQDYWGDFTEMGIPLTSEYMGREVFLPITLRNGNEVLEIACCTVRVTGQKTIVRTALAERIGTVKEQFQVGDYQFSVKGVLIAPTNRTFPDIAISALRAMYEATTPIRIENALTDLFLDTSQYICLTALEFPEVEGGDKRHRPFTFTAESDYINSLTL